MPDTESLYVTSDEAQHQLDCIATARAKAFAKFEAITQELRLETGASVKDAGYLLDHIHDGLSDMLDAVTARWQSETGNANDAISNVEERDLQRSAPVLL